MGQRQIQFQDVLQLVELIKSSSNFSEIRLRFGDVEVDLRRHGGASQAVAPMVERIVQAPSPESADERAVPSTVAPVVRTSVPARAARQAGDTVVTAPMVGTVYRASEPGATPFVSVGQSVSPDDPICIVEVMKLMNSIAAGCHGVVTEILVADGEAVAYGQELFVISTH